MPWIAAAIAVVSLIWIVTPLKQSTNLPTLDVALIFSCILAAVVLCTSSTGLSTGLKETFISLATDQEDDAWLQDLVTMTANLVLYVSSFRTDSYPGTDQPANIWKSVTQSPVTGTVCQPPASMDFTFNTLQPVWKAGTGFALANSILTGPLSMDIFPQTRSQAYTAFALFQISGLPLDGSSATLLYIPANGAPVQNGATLELSAVGTPTGSSVKAYVQLTLGNQDPLACSDNGSMIDQTVAFDTHARYLITITRSSTNVRVSLFHVESSSSQCMPNILLNATIIDDGLVYNNQAIVINDTSSGEGISGNIMAFGIFDDALLPQDEAAICSHYHDLLLMQDPLVQKARAVTSAAALAAACPYDATTCSACAGVKSWSNPFQIANAGGSVCMSAIDAYCNSNPTSAGCDCYDPANSASQTCQALITAYSGDNSTFCSGSVQQALAAEENTRNTLAEAQAKAKQDQQDERRTLELSRKEAEIDESAGSSCTQTRPSFFAWLFGL